MVNHAQDWIWVKKFFDLPNKLIPITGGLDKTRTDLADVVDYDPDADKWTKVGEMAKARSFHGMSLVPAETADYCVWCLSTEIIRYDFI